MQRNTKPHQADRASALPWEETLPSHWEVRKLRSILKPINVRDHAELPLLSVVRERGVILRDLDNTDDNHNVIPEDLSNYKLVRPKQFAINKMKAWQGSYGVSQDEGIVSPAYFVFDVRNIDPAFLHRATRSRAYVPLFDRASDGVRIGQWDLSLEHLRDIPIAVPPTAEQAAIVRYLDHADELINRYISAKERLIALLEQQRQAVIHQAVTRGLDLNVCLKTSGVEWLGDVPHHWKRRRLKEVATIQAGITIGPDNGKPGLAERPYLRVANVQAEHLDLSQVTTIRVSPAEIKRSTLQVGDVLMTEGGDIDKLGRGCIWQGEIPGCLHQNHVFAVRPDPALLNPKFLAAIMGSAHGRTYFFLTAKQTTNLAATNRTTLGNFPIHLPSASEQLMILNHVENQCDAVDNAIMQARQQIGLINEYHTRLIADVVTGQIDVRDAVAELPD